MTHYHVNGSPVAACGKAVVLGVTITGFKSYVTCPACLRKIGPIPARAVEEAERVVDRLTHDEREELFSHYCRHCGTKNPKCRCWDDS